MDYRNMRKYNLAVLVLLAFVQEIISLAATPNPPNIVLIVADDYGYRDIGYHGAEFGTPTLDKLASEGVKLENYYVQPICSPTRSQLMTGRYQIHTGLQHNIIWPSQPYGLPLEFPTIADILKTQNFSTHAIGKWHLGFFKKPYTPLHRGFDTFYGYWEGGEDYYTYKNSDWFHSRNNPEAGNGGIHTNGHSWKGYDLRDMEKPVTDKNGTYSTLLYTEKAIDLIKNVSKSDKPFFLYLAYQAVHSPMEAPDKYVKPYVHIKDKKRRIYAGMVSCLDEGVKNVTNALKEYGLMDNTVLIFTTDNGGETREGGNNWPLRGRKHTLWEGGVRGIGFVNSPLLKPEQRGSINTELIHVSDWFPTIADIVGAKVNKSIDGLSQWRTIRDGARGPRDEILHNIDIWKPLKGKLMFNNTFDTRVRAAIRVSHYKLITGDPGVDDWFPVPNITSSVDIHKESEYTRGSNDTKNLWLFNIIDDPTEKHDLSDSMPEVVESLLRRLSQYNATAVPPQYPDSDPNCDPQKHGGYWGPWM